MINFANKEIVKSFETVFKKAYPRYDIEKPEINTIQEINVIACHEGFKHYVAISDTMDNYGKKIMDDPVIKSAYELLAEKAANTLAEIFVKEVAYKNACILGVQLYCWINLNFEPAWPEMSHSELWFGVHYIF